jgi:hypothetical protein
MLILAVPMIGSAPHNQHLPESYVYNIMPWGYYPTPAPAPYRYVKSMYAWDVGADNFMSIMEVKYHNERFFITNGNTFIITDNDLVATAIHTGVTINGVFQNFMPLNGIYITPTGDIYLCEPLAERVLHFNSDFELIRVLGKPADLPIGHGSGGTDVYRPIKVTVDHHGRIYIIVEGRFEGMVELNPDGTFNRFFGRVEVRPTARELFLRAIQTPAQRIRSALFLPVNFTNLTVCKDGFIYATLSEARTEFGAKKLNSRGMNIMRRPFTGHYVGDMEFNRFGIHVPFGPSIMTIIEVTDFGVYYVYDSKRNRIFAYDQDGYMLYAFGGTGSREGLTGSVNGMTMASGGRLVFTDITNRSIEVFERTVYGDLVMAAAELQYRNDYIGAADYWREVLVYNPFFQYAYLGVGIALYREGRFEEAMGYFEYGQSPEFYSMAYQEVRSQAMMDSFNTIMTVLIALLVLYILFKMFKKKIIDKIRTNRQRGELT